jgi:GTPase SAR1 family protein
MSNYSEFQTYKLSLNVKLDELYNITDELGYTSLSVKIKDYRNTVDNDQFIITVVGEFNRGKSTLINALIGDDVIPTGILPTTATINIIRYDEKKRIIIHNTDNETFEIPFNKESFLDYTALVNFDPNRVKFVEITLPSPLLEDGVVLVDTPGVNDINEQRIEITYGYLPISDAIIFLLNSTTPLKMTEVDFLTNHILSNNIDKIFFVSNQVDLLDDSDCRDSLNSLKDNLQFLGKGKEINVYPLSSKEALRGILIGDDNLIKKSQYNEFKNVLLEFLKGDDKNIFKIKRIDYHYNALLQNVWNEIEGEAKINQKSIEELIEIKDKLTIRESVLKDNLSKLFEYIDEQSVQLLKRVEGSLLIKMKELNEAFNFQIDKYKSDLTDFVEKDIPYSIKQSLKIWLEQSQPSIDENVYTIYQKGIQGFEQHFAKLTIIESLMNVNKQDLTVNPTNITLSKTHIDQNISQKTFVTGAVVAVGVIATLTTGGLLPILFGAISGGSIAQRFWGQNLMKKEVEIQKAELKNKLPQVLSETFNSFFAVLVNNIGSTFNGLKTSLEKEFNLNLSQIMEDVNRNINDNRKDMNKIESRENVLTEYRNKLELLA